MHKITIDYYTIEVSNPDKVLFPEDGITKEDLVSRLPEIFTTERRNQDRRAPVYIDTARNALFSEVTTKDDMVGGT